MRQQAEDSAARAGATSVRSLPGRRGSCWTAAAETRSYPSLQGSIHAETAVVGAGIVGLTTALKLCEAGRSVVLVEALRAGRQVTARSTAKITPQHGLIYRHLKDRLGLDGVRAYASANSAGVARIRDWISRYGIDCDLQDRDAYAFILDPARRDELVSEARAAHGVGLRADVLDRAPLPFSNAGALRFPEQCQFNPAKYASGLAAAIAARGGRLFENSRVRLIGEASRWRVVTDGGSVHAEHVVVATNITVKSPVGMATRTQPRCHTAMAFRVEDERVIDGMFIGLDEPTRSIRTGRDERGPVLVVLGPKFDTGHDGDVAERFRELEEWARSALPVGDVAWRWCNEDYDTADRVPYAGTADPEKAPGFHIATGFNGWGITNGTAAGILISDLICGCDNVWLRLYDPQRPFPRDFHRDGDSQSIVTSLEDIPPEGGGVLVRGDAKIAVHRDAEGNLHTLSAACTHKGCTVTWNNADLTWDCPCHGSIFDARGSVLHGPARKALAPAKL